MLFYTGTFADFYQAQVLFHVLYGEFHLQEGQSNQLDMTQYSESQR